MSDNEASGPVPDRTRAGTTRTVSNEYKISYAVELEATLVYHIYLIGAQLHLIEGDPNRPQIPKRRHPEDSTETSAVIHNPFPRLVQNLRGDERFMIHANEPLLAKWAHSRPRYRSWGVLHPSGIEAGRDFADTDDRVVPTPNYMIAVGRRHTPRSQNPNSSVRAFGSEVLQIGVEILRSQEQEESEQYWNVEKPTDFHCLIDWTPQIKRKRADAWTLTTQASLIGLRRDALEAYLKENKKCTRLSRKRGPGADFDNPSQNKRRRGNDGTSRQVRTDPQDDNQAGGASNTEAGGAGNAECGNAEGGNVEDGSEKDIDQWILTVEQWQSAHPNQELPKTPESPAGSEGSGQSPRTANTSSAKSQAEQIQEYIRMRRELSLSKSPCPQGRGSRRGSPHSNSSSSNSSIGEALQKLRRLAANLKPLNRLNEGFGPLKTDDWDSSGIVLLSPFEDAGNEASYQMINRLCTRLKGKACHLHGATTSEFCGLKVHVKAQEERVDFVTMKHFCYIIYTHEELIDKLMPWHRRVNYWHQCTSHTDIWSNRDAFATQELNADELADVIDLAAGAGFTYADAWLDRSHWFPRTHLSRDDIWTAIFGVPPSTIGWENMQKLIENFHQDRRKFDDDSDDDSDKDAAEDHAISLIRYLDTMRSYPATIEFRQHEGVLRGDMIRWWTKFCSGLLRLAKHMADLERAGTLQVDDPDHGYWFSEDEKDMCIWDLFNHMGFPTEGIDYFKRRAAYFAVRGPNDSPQLGDGSEANALPRLLIPTPPVTPQPPRRR